MSDSSLVRMGVCSVTFNGIDLGYTKGGVKVSYSADSVEKTVDQEDAPIGEIITKQKFEVKVPLAEHDLTKLVELLPNATLYTSGTTKKRIELSGEAGTDLMNSTAVLTLTPLSGDANDSITLKYAAPKANMEFAFEKENVRVFEITFTALKGVGGWVTMGDISVMGVDSITPSSGSTAGGTAVTIIGAGFTGATAVNFGSTAGTAFTVVSDRKITVTSPAGSVGLVDITIVKATGDKVVDDGYTYTA